MVFTWLFSVVFTLAAYAQNGQQNGRSPESYLADTALWIDHAHVPVWRRMWTVR